MNIGDDRFQHFFFGKQTGQIQTFYSIPLNHLYHCLRKELTDISKPSAYFGSRGTQPPSSVTIIYSFQRMVYPLFFQIQCHACTVSLIAAQYQTPPFQ